MSDIDMSGPNEQTNPVLAGEPEERQPQAGPQDAVKVPASSRSSLHDEGDIEEGYGVYKPGHFHPVYIGDVYNGRYLVLSKLGYGLYSTVWLVKDTSSEDRKYYAMKVLSAACYGADKDIFEREVLRHLRDADKSHVGY